MTDKIRQAAVEMSETPMNMLRALCEKFKCPNCRVEHIHDCFCYAHAAELRAILPDMERLAKELFDSHGITCNVRGHAVGAGQGCNYSPAISKVELANLKANVERLVEAAQKYLNCPHLNMLGYFGHCGECRLILAQALALFDQPVAPGVLHNVKAAEDMREEVARRLPWWCCSAPYGQHEETCKNFVADQPVAPKETKADQ